MSAIGTHGLCKHYQALPKSQTCMQALLLLKQAIWLHVYIDIAGKRQKAAMPSFDFLSYPAGHNSQAQAVMLPIKTHTSVFTIQLCTVPKREI